MQTEVHTSLFSCRYGFLRDRCQPERCRSQSGAAYSNPNYLQYVHCTGGMFVMIPDNRTTSLPRQRKLAVNSHTEYITRQRSWTSKSRSNGAGSGSSEQKEHRSYYEVGLFLRACMCECVRASYLRQFHLCVADIYRRAQALGMVLTFF